jgi:enoyl-CoA hydratase/carnithine racemase
MCGSLTFPRIFGPSRTFEILVLAKTVNAKLLVDHGFALKSYPTVQAMEDDVN